jgi:glutathione peroxidase
MTNAYDFEHKTIDGADKALSDYRGKALLVVNVASRCGLTPQYTALEELYRGMKDRGLLVLGFPCNQFAGQEPGTEAEIKQFCSTQYDVTFPLFGKLDVNGASRHPLYAWLTAQPTKPEGPGDVTWNFGKFLIDREGNVAARFSPTTSPTSPDLIDAVERVLS